MNRITSLVLQIAAAFVMALCIAPVADAQNKKLRIGVEGAYPPFSEIDTTGKLKGFDIDITNALCVQMKRDCELVQLAFDGMIPALQSRKIDAVIASMSITDERRKAVEFSNKYYRTPARFVVKTGSKLELTPAGLKGKRVGVQRSTTHDRYIADVYKDAQVIRYTKQDEVFLDLASGRLDAAFLDSIAADIGFLKKPAGKGFVFGGPEIEDRKYFGDGAGVALRKSDTALRDEFNAAIAALRTNGTYKTIQDKYFDFDVYGSAPGTVAAPPASPSKPAAAKK